VSAEGQISADKSRANFGALPKRRRLDFQPRAASPPDKSRDFCPLRGAARHCQNARPAIFRHQIVNRFIDGAHDGGEAPFIEFTAPSGMLCALSPLPQESKPLLRLVLITGAMMSDTTPPANQGSFSFGRVLLVAIPLALLMWGASALYSRNVQDEAASQQDRKTFSGLFGAGDDATTLSDDYKDTDGDLVADAPSDDECIDPEEIVFSYVASSDTEGAEETWEELVAALAQRTGREVTLTSYTDTDEQMRALEDGKLHVTAFGTGEVQGAVNEAGFVPLACFANEDGEYSYKMVIIVPADSKIKEVADLKGSRLKFVRPRSNSGCTAALVMLMKDHDLQPDRDYAWGFSYGHETSIRGVAEEEQGFDAAAVASDILERMIAAGDVPEDAVRIIYESDPYPPGVLGMAYNLTPELREAVRDTLLEFDWSGTGLEKEFGGSGAVKFAAVSYKDDWAPVREIRETGGELLAQLGGQ
jgi:phosphonate transport system substrate-binding protein